MAWGGRDLNVQSDDQIQSRINSAGLINVTLENLWKDCYNAMAKSDFNTWNRKLDAVWVILGGDVPEGGEEDKAYMALDLKIYETGNLGIKKDGFKVSGGDNKPMQYQLLKKKSLFLRRLQNKQGKGTAYANEDDDDMD